MLGAAVVVLVLAAAGCGGGGVDEADETPTTVEPSTASEPTSPPTTLADEQAVLEAYQGYWDTWLAANDPPNPDHPDLERYATGAALVSVRESIEQHRLGRPGCFGCRRAKHLRAPQPWSSAVDGDTMPWCRLLGR